MKDVLNRTYRFVGIEQTHHTENVYNNCKKQALYDKKMSKHFKIMRVNAGGLPVSCALPGSGFEEQHWVLEYRQMTRKIQHS